MPLTIFEFACGCQDTAYITLTGKNVCPYHRERIVKKYRRCDKCRKIVECNLRANSKTFFCPDCRPWNTSRLKAKNRKEAKDRKDRNPYRKEYTKNPNGVHDDPLAPYFKPVEMPKMSDALRGVLQKGGVL